MKAHHSPDPLAHVDSTLIHLDQLHALAELLAGEDGATQFANLSLDRQVALFGLFEDLLAEMRTALTDTAAAPAAGSTEHVSRERP